MVERYTESARRTLFFARYEAKQFGSPSIGIEHLVALEPPEQRVIVLIASRIARQSRSRAPDLWRRAPSVTTRREAGLTIATTMPRRSPLKRVVAHTDGACVGNPGPGGYGVVLQYGDHRRELSGGFRRTTNNRMELTAVIKALEALKEPCRVDLFSDSEYVVNGIMKGWARTWRARKWRRSAKPVPNWELWSRLLELCEHHEVHFRWVEGHAGHVENERCDELAASAAAGTDLVVDPGYEQPRAPA
jgi:ribonuclease HI